MTPVGTMPASEHTFEAAATPPRRGLALHVALGSGAVALSLHMLQLLSLGPWAADWPRAGAWPTAFHAWLLETVALTLAVGTLAYHRTRPRWLVWWRGLDGAQRALRMALALVAAQLLLGAAFWLTRDHGVDQLGWLRAAFYLGGEFRIPVFFATAQALLASWLAWQLHRRERQRVWAAVAGICAYIGADELLSIHERVGNSVRELSASRLDSLRAIALSGDVYVYTWQLVFLPIALVVGLWMLKHLWHVADARTLTWLTLAAILFVVGSVGFETVQATAAVQNYAWTSSSAGQLNLLLEETLETLGMTVAAWVFARRRWRVSGA